MSFGAHNKQVRGKNIEGATWVALVVFYCCEIVRREGVASLLEKKKEDQ